MKLRDKLKISFCVMIILPVIMLCVFVVGIFKMQSDSICKTYNVGDNALFIKCLFESREGLSATYTTFPPRPQKAGTVARQLYKRSNDR